MKCTWIFSRQRQSAKVTVKVLESLAHPLPKTKKLFTTQKEKLTQFIQLSMSIILTIFHLNKHMYIPEYAIKPD